MPHPARTNRRVDDVPGGGDAWSMENNAAVTVTRTDVKGGKFAYLVTGQINDETYDSTPLISASKVAYTHMSLTRIESDERGSVDGYREVVAFHKTAAAAGKGCADLRKWAKGIRVVEITVA